MIIKTVWANRTYSDEPELVTAWDEYCVDANPEGFQEDVKKSLESWRGELDEVRYINISIPDKAIYDAFRVTEVSGQVV